MENFICPNDHYSLTISKTTDSKKVIELKKPENLIEYYKKEDNVNMQFDIKFEQSELDTYLSSSKKINEGEKKNILKFYNYNLKKNISKYNLKCSQCGHQYVLFPETIIYSLNFKKQQSSFNDEVEDLIDLKFNDPTLPRTKDYICIHSTCPSHHKNFDNSLKEAVFYRANGTFHMKYACLVCRGKPWNI